MNAKTLRGLAKRTSPQLRRYLSPLGWQRELPLSAPLSARRAVLRGFKPSSYALYDFARNNPKDYLPDTVFYASAYLNGAFAREVLSDKLRFFETLSGDLPIPPVLAQVVGGRLEPVLPGMSTPEALLEHLRAHGEVIFKPRRGQKGRGVFALGLSKTAGQLAWNAEERSPAELGFALEKLDGYLITEKVAHAPYADVFPHAVNSARVIVVQDQALGLSPFVPAAVQRFGAAGTGVTDNAARGGVYAGIDLETGELSAAVRPAASFSKPNIWFSHHPETGAPIQGVRVPRWVEVKRALLEVTARYPAFKYIGWDVVVTEAGFAVLEGNVAPSLAVQIFFPYLKDPRMRTFFVAYGLI